MYVKGLAAGKVYVVSRQGVYFWLAHAALAERAATDIYFFSYFKEHAYIADIATMNKVAQDRSITEDTKPTHNSIKEEEIARGS